MKKLFPGLLLCALCALPLTASSDGPAAGLSLSRLVELGLFDTPQQAVLRTRNMEHFKGDFCNEYAIEQAGLAPPINIVTFADSVQVGPLPVNDKFGSFDYSSYDGSIRNRLDFLAWAPDGAHLDVNRNGIPEPNEPRLNIDGQQVVIDQVENYLSTLPTGRFHYKFWDGIEIGYAPSLVRSEIQWNGQSESVTKVLNHNYDLPYIVAGQAGNLDVSSQVQIVNTDIVDWSLQVDFRDLLSGNVVSTRIGDNVQSTHQITVPAGSSRQLEVESVDGNLASYTAHLRTNYDLGNPALQLNVRFETRDSEDNLKGSAGIGVGRADTFHVLSVSRDMKVDTGVGIYLSPLYAGYDPAVVDLLLVGDGNQVLGKATTEVGPGQAVVKFLGEFFDLGGTAPQGLQALPEAFEATLLISAPYDVTVFALQTENGFQQSSLTSNGSPVQSF